MKYEAESVDAYIEQIPEEKKPAFRRLRAVVLGNLPEGFEECISYGGPAYAVPHSIYPKGYHCNPDEPLPFISILSQKNYIGFYHGGIYVYPDLQEWFKNEWEKLDIGRLDMGKSCIRLKKIDNIPYDLLGELCSKITVAQWIAKYEEGRAGR